MWQKSKPYLLVLPAWGILVLFFYGGMVNGLTESLGFSPMTGGYRFSLVHYYQLLTSWDFWQSLGVTLRISILSTVAASVLGLFIAVGLFSLGKSRFRSIGLRAFLMPLLIPHLVGAYLMVLLFMQSGWLSRVAYHLGWIHQIEEFPILINEPFGWGMILTYAWKESPFIGLMLFPVLQRIYGSWVEVARVFGASRWDFFRAILFPLLMPALLSSSFIVFAFTFSSFEVPFLLGVTYPKMLPVLSYDLYTSGGFMDRQKALAINVMLALITGLLSIISYRISKYWNKLGGGGWM
jgi:putative spermidine/putrescine transport system permease protein